MDFILQKDIPRQAIERSFPQNIRVEMNEAVAKAYELALSTLENTSYLNDSDGRGKDSFPYLKNFAVEFVLRNFIKQGKLPYKYEIKYNRNKSARYFIMKNLENTVEICVNQVKRKSCIGRPAHYRNQRIKQFQSYMLLDDQEQENSEIDIISKPPIYFELNHGYQSFKPTFVVLGIPNKIGEWVDYIEISKELHVLENPSGIQTQVANVEDFDLNEFLEYLNESEINE
ncbi:MULTISPECIES: hypothetical protein [Bacillus]|uniref:hypothetical protein n=1 Tax=Bacillus TaxID=1386 RepID=UPI00032EC94B|nr:MULTISPECIES: hypothetical protein [Bacillus]EOP21324.1 hypothetical protein IIS_03910 [Bacillus cereus VD131]KAF6559229.1 hypothetical protein G9F74_10670 [Bacillus sp. EKM202B]MBJ8039444.1 hypothetical protein [Bacillus cereus group sp. N17]MCU5728041.1 hypothetical protein [Bacillus toyonensis]MDD9261324.1 hypothetical protein [Bacillus toyonensis]